MGAEVGATIADGEALVRGAAVRARFATAMGNLKLKVGGADLSARAQVGIHAGAFITNG